MKVKHFNCIHFICFLYERTKSLVYKTFIFTTHTYAVLLCHYVWFVSTVFICINYCAICVYLLVSVHEKPFNLHLTLSLPALLILLQRRGPLVITTNTLLTDTVQTCSVFISNEICMDKNNSQTTPFHVSYWRNLL